MASRIREAVDAPNPFAGYGGGGDRPLLPYAGLASTWLLGLASFLGLARALHKPMPRLTGGDIALLAGATFHLSRLITKDSILSFMRAPFTRFKETGAAGETNEEPRKETELQHAVGELLSCPFCMATWVAAGLIYGHTFFPAVTRLIAGMFCVVGLADALQLAYGTASKKAE
jgi:hypothetical protein